MRWRRAMLVVTALVFGTMAIVVRAGWMSAAGAAPTNDDFAHAQVLSGASGSVSVTTAGATAEQAEPEHVVAQPATATVWFSWTASAVATATVDTCKSDYDTLLAVYTGVSLAGLSPVASNDDWCGPQSRASFVTTAGTTYWIAIDGFAAATGNLNLDWSLPLTAPSNNAFAAAAAITGSAGTVSATTVAATLETNEPLPGGVAVTNSVWYSYTPTTAGLLTVDTCTATTVDTVVAVYTGATVASLSPLASDDDACGVQSAVTLSVAAATVYRIQVATTTESSGAFSLQWSRSAPGAPGPPTITETLAGDGWVAVAWDPSAMTGTSATTSYLVTASPGGATASIAAPGTRAVLTNLTNDTSYTFRVTATNASGASGASGVSSIETPTAGTITVDTYYDDSEIDRMQQTATYFGTTTGQAQHDCVAVIAFILGLIPPGPTPISPVPTNTGPAVVTSTWTPTEQQFIVSVAQKYAFTPGEAQKFSSQLVGFLLALGGN